MTKNIFFHNIIRKFRNISISSKIIFLIIVDAMLITSNWYFLNDFINTTKYDAQIINESGIIRGTIQKVVKLETNKINSDQYIHIVDTLLEKNLHPDSILEKHGHDNFINELTKVRDNWQIIKKLIYDYREIDNFKLKNEILQKSKENWKFSNNTTGVAQFNAELKQEQFSQIYYRLFLDFILVISILITIYLLVKLKLEEQARIDPLTKIYNRHVFYENIEIEISSSRRHGYPLSIVLIDIDFFKKINDSYGHDEGDRVLIEFAKLINTHIRKEDTLCRFGGEEFIIITPHVTVEQAKIFSEKLRSAIEHNNFGKVGIVTASIGVTTLNKSDTIETFFKRVDEAVYLSKENGRNRVSYLQ